MFLQGKENFGATITGKPSRVPPASPGLANKDGVIDWSVFADLDDGKLRITPNYFLGHVTTAIKIHLAKLLKHRIIQTPEEGLNMYVDDALQWSTVIDNAVAEDLMRQYSVAAASGGLSKGDAQKVTDDLEKNRCIGISLPRI